MARRNKSGFTPMEFLFVQFFEGDQTQAAKAAGFANPRVHGSRLMRRPHIQKAIAEKLAAATNESAKRMARPIDFGRNDIIMGLADLARKAESESARVTAWGKLADIFQLSQKGTKDADIFSGWTEEELDYYRKTGEIPLSRLGLSAEASTSNDGSNREASPSAGALSVDHGPSLGTGGGHRSAAAPAPTKGK